jgi:hypothetical protein
MTTAPLAYLTVDELKTYLRITDAIDDEVLAEIVAAAMAQQAARCATYFAVLSLEVNPLDYPPADPTPITEVDPDLHLAAQMRGARLYARRASPEGIIPLGDLGVARIPRLDGDIDALEAPWRDVVLA